MKTGRFRSPGKKALLKDSDYPEFVVMDVTETAIERPKKKTEDILLRQEEMSDSKNSSGN